MVVHPVVIDRRRSREPVGDGAGKGEDKHLGCLK